MEARAQGPGPCSLCIDGTEAPFLDNPVFDFENPNVTCANLAAFAPGIIVQDEESFLACRQLQDVGLSNCGCETPPELKTGCTLCPGGNDLLPEPEKEILPFVSCEGISRVVERWNETECLAYQRVIGEYCGCPDAPTEDVCRICGDGQFVDFPSAAVDLSELGLDAVPCAFYETIANEPQDLPCGVFQLEAPTCCELPSRPPSAPSNIGEICNPVTIGASQTAYLECAITCIQASCCEGPCLSSDIATCAQYLPCGSLEMVPFPEESEDVTMAPSPMAIERTDPSHDG